MFFYDCQDPCRRDPCISSAKSNCCPEPSPWRPTPWPCCPEPNWPCQVLDAVFFEERYCQVPMRLQAMPNACCEIEIIKGTGCVEEAPIHGLNICSIGCGKFCVKGRVCVPVEVAYCPPGSCRPCCIKGEIELPIDAVVCVPRCRDFNVRASVKLMIPRGCYPVRNCCVSVDLAAKVVVEAYARMNSSCGFERPCPRPGSHCNAGCCSEFFRRPLFPQGGRTDWNSQCRRC
ncbi:hypothetical protein [Gehongia tenuis]|uniref:Uncharacterized protein n=1 Tax=Gehongia tenuis TaxID=2763655 RepID=A0A926D4D7_9FIRM|nr:hypothetical protein [Gehongia tenuis]MBC8531133.1 hypothetical protein [Gehongia tenuis]